MYTQEDVIFARDFARKYHKNQVDKCGRDYVTTHLDSVASQVNLPFLKIVAYLHDIIEDTECSLSDIQKVFGKQVSEAVYYLSRQEKETYMDYINRLCANEAAKIIKYYDLLDHIVDENDSTIPTNILSLQKRYKKALDIIKNNNVLI